MHPCSKPFCGKSVERDLSLSTRVIQIDITNTPSEAQTFIIMCLSSTKTAATQKHSSSLHTPARKSASTPRPQVSEPRQAAAGFTLN